MRQETRAAELAKNCLELVCARKSGETASSLALLDVRQSISFVVGMESHLFGHSFSERATPDALGREVGQR